MWRKSFLLHVLLAREYSPLGLFGIGDAVLRKSTFFPVCPMLRLLLSRRGRQNEEPHRRHNDGKLVLSN